MERARLLPAFVELAVAAEQIETARDAAAELDALATLYGSDALTATACWAIGGKASQPWRFVEPST